MGQNKSKEYEAGSLGGQAEAPTLRAEVVRRDSQMSSQNDVDKRRRRKWRKKQGYSLPAVGGSMGNLNPEDEDLPPAPVERGAVLVSYSRSDAERFAPLRPKIINRRKDRQMSFGDVTSDELFVDTPTSTRSCLTLDKNHGLAADPVSAFSSSQTNVQPHPQFRERASPGDTRPTPKASTSSKDENSFLSNFVKPETKNHLDPEQVPMLILFSGVILKLWLNIHTCRSCRRGLNDITKQCTNAKLQHSA
jgi:hypothetical protein